jgi:maleylacetoacetate isomerase
MVLYDYWRSSASYRVRIALNLKGLEYQQNSIHLVRDGGEQKKPEYKAINPQGLVPTLVDDGVVLTQSMAIMEYLDERYPKPPLLPVETIAKARVRAMALVVACDIHPLNNSSVTAYIGETLQQSATAVNDWYRHWIARGFAALEILLENSATSGLCCFGDEPGLADICLVPQVYNAERFNCDLAPYVYIRRISSYCRGLKAFTMAAPENQADAD